MDLFYLGGPDYRSSSAYVERTWYGFAHHNILYFAFEIILGGIWQPSDSFTLHFDGRVLETFHPHQAVTMHSTSSCNSTYNAVMRTNVQGKAFHTSSMLTFRFSWSLKGTGSPFIAIKDLSVFFAMKTPDDVEEAYLTLSDTSLPYSTPCWFGQYYDTTTSSCKNCDPACPGCFGGANTQCFIPVWYGSFDGTITFTCSSGCKNCFGPAADQCINCLAPNDVVDENNVCQSGCTAPYVEYGDASSHICLLPCQANEYRLWNDTCASSCDAPLVPTLDISGNSCSYPCGVSINSFLLRDGTCSSVCPPPHYVRNENNYLFCDLCQPGYFLYDDGTCGALTPSDMTEMKHITKIQHTLGQLLSLSALIAIFLNVATPTASAYPVIIVNMLQYLKYIEIAYPSKLQYMLDSSIDLSFNIFVGLSENMRIHVPNYPVPGRFARYDTPSSFLVNFGNSGLSLLSLLIAVLLVMILEYMTPKYKKLHGVIKNIRQALKWNYCLVLFLPYFKDIVVFTSLELRTAHWRASLSVLSFLLCICMNLITTFVIVKIVKVLKTLRGSYQKHSDEAPDNKNTPLKAGIPGTLKDYEIVYKDYKQQSFFQQAFLLFTVMRLYILYFIIGYLFDHPVAQMTLILLTNICMLIYLSYIRPHQRKTQLAECITGEIMLLIVNICTFVLSILDALKAEALVSRKKLGDAVIAINLILTVIACIDLAVKIGAHTIKLYKASRNASLKRKVKPSQVHREEKDIAIPKKEADQPVEIKKLPKIEIISLSESENPHSLQDSKPLLQPNYLVSPMSQSGRLSCDLLPGFASMQDSIVTSVDKAHNRSSFSVTQRKKIHSSKESHKAAGIPTPKDSNNSALDCENAPQDSKPLLLKQNRLSLSKASSRKVSIDLCSEFSLTQENVISSTDKTPELPAKMGSNDVEQNPSEHLVNRRSSFSTARRSRVRRDLLARPSQPVNKIKLENQNLEETPKNAETPA